MQYCCHYAYHCDYAIKCLKGSVAETRWPRWRPTLPARASMGPQLYRCGNHQEVTVDLEGVDGLQWGRNFIVAETRPLGGRQERRKDSFNGAATLSLRKLSDTQQSIAAWVWLQWGRNFIVAETRLGERGAVRLVLASMGPQLYRCGNSDDPDTQDVGTSASMGPQLYRCGNYMPQGPHWRRRMCFNGAATLSLRKR